VEVPVEKVIEVPVDRIVEKIIEQRVEVPVYQEKIVYRDRETPLVSREVEVVEVEKVREVPVPYEVEKVREVPVPYEVEKVREVVREVPVEVVRFVDRPFEVEKIREVSVPYEVEKIREVKSEVVVLKEVPVPIDKIVYVEVSVPHEIKVRRPAARPCAAWPPVLIARVDRGWMEEEGKLTRVPRGGALSRCSTSWKRWRSGRFQLSGWWFTRSPFKSRSWC
jgi:hypothetical protein